jgi:hypothetical protein
MSGATDISWTSLWMLPVLGVAVMFSGLPVWVGLQHRPGCVGARQLTRC